MSIIAVMIRDEANRLLDRLPTPSLSETTAGVYAATMRRMLAEDDVDPLRSGDARDTYNLRRAALHAGTWQILRRELTALDDAARRGDRDEAQRALAALARVLERCGPAIERDPPADRTRSTFTVGASRWTTSDIPHPRRGKGSKKNVLRDLPADWMRRVWDAAPRDWAYLDALAVHMLTPVRPSEFVPGERAGRWIPGVEVMLDGDTLMIAVAPAKTHCGKYGTGESIMQFRVDSQSQAVQHLVSRCRSAGRQAIVVALDGTNAMRQALARLGRRGLGDDVKLTPYVFRNQVIADYKKTFGSGAAVAAAAGHCTDRTQSHYGRVEHGWRRKELIGVTSSRAPRLGSIERARALSAIHSARLKP